MKNSIGFNILKHKITFSPIRISIKYNLMCVLSLHITNASKHHFNINLFQWQYYSPKNLTFAFLRMYKSNKSDIDNITYVSLKGLFNISITDGKCTNLDIAYINFIAPKLITIG
jgi:hypothetical protein